MGRRLGVIAGSGEFPIHLYGEARNLGYDCVVAGIKGEADPSLAETVGVLEWFDIQDFEKLIAFFRKNGVSEAVFAGKIDHRLIYKNETLSKILPSLLGKGTDSSPSALIQTAIKIFSSQGVSIKDPTPYIASAFCEPGVLTKAQPRAEAEEDIRFGWEIARRLADWDIGQTVIVKRKAVVAVEGIEGTDEAIRRAGHLAGDGIVVIKVSRSEQDPRIDLPAVGLNSVKSLIQAGGQTLCFEAQKVPFFQKAEAIALADSHGVSIVAKS
jgi:DUF1009 family protein